MHVRMLAEGYEFHSRTLFSTTEKICFHDLAGLQRLLVLILWNGILRVCFNRHFYWCTDEPFSDEEIGNPAQPRKQPPSRH
jgi:hypothetical protein